MAATSGGGKRKRGKSRVKKPKGSGANTLYRQNNTRRPGTKKKNTVSGTKKKTTPKTLTGSGKNAKGTSMRNAASKPATRSTGKGGPNATSSRRAKPSF